MRGSVPGGEFVGDVMACPVCNARVPPGAAQCLVCRSSLSGLVGAAPASRPSSPSLGFGPSGHGRLPLGPLGSREVASSPPPSHAPPGPAAPAPRGPAPRPFVPASNDDDDVLATRDEVTHQRASLEPGVVLHDRYEIRHAMGEGALGASWAARDARTGAEVVLKVVADMLVHNERERGDLVGKLEMFAGRTLPGVVMPREVFAVPGCAVLVYPAVDAVSLRAVIDARRAEGGRFSPEECLRVMLSLSSAVQAMHTASPHGALWPQNVLISARGVLLVDGFIAVSVPPDRLAARVGHHARSAPFLAPELLAGKRPTASADLYALGAIVAELAGGAPPGEGPDIASMSRELHRAAATLLDREPGRRPAGVQALLDALASAAGFERRPPEPPLTVPESVLARAADFDETHAAPAIDPPTLPAPERASPAVRSSLVAAAPPSQAAPPPRPSQPLPPPRETSAPPGPPGRLRGPTATLPASGARPQGAAVSGPPPSMAVKSGPPPSAAPIAPSAPASRVPAAIAPVSQPRSLTAPSRPPSPPALSPPAALASDAPAEPRSFPKTLPSINQAISSAARAMRAGVPAMRPPSSPVPMPRPAVAPPRAPVAPARPPAAPPRPPAVPPRPPMASARPPPPAPRGPVAPPSSAAPSRPPQPGPPASKRPPERSFGDDDEIDPKLLRAAHMLDDERRRDR